MSPRYRRRRVLTWLTAVLAALSGTAVLAPPATAASGQAYVALGDNTFGRLDLATGSVSRLGNLSSLPQALAADGSRLYGIQNDSNPSLVTIDKTNGAATLVGDLNGHSSNEYFDGLTVDAAGRMFAIGILFSGFELSQQLYQVNKATGAATPVGSAADPNVVPAIAGLAGACGGAVYAVDVDSVALWTIDPSTGTVTKVANLSGASFSDPIVDIAFQHSTRTLFAITGGNRVLTINPATAAATPLFTINPSPHATLHALAIDGVSACRYSRSVNVSYSAAQAAFVGSVDAQITRCENGVRVKVFRQRSGPDLLIGSVLTNQLGTYKVPSSAGAGTYYATSPKVATPLGVCLGARSQNLTR